MFAHVPLVAYIRGPESGSQFAQPAVREVDGRQVLVERGVHAGGCITGVPLDAALGAGCLRMASSSGP